MRELVMDAARGRWAVQVALGMAAACAFEPIAPEETGAPRVGVTEASATAVEGGPGATREAVSLLVQGTRPVNLRTGPGLEHGIVGQTLPGTALRALGKDAAGAWYAVAWEGAQVWIYGELVSVENGEGLPVVAIGTATPATPETPQPEPAAEEGARLVVEASTAVNLRAGPSTEHGIAGTALPGAAFEAVGKDVTGTWYAVDWEGAWVWIYGGLVSVENGNGLPVITEGIPPKLPTPTPASGAVVPVREGCELVWNDEFEEDGFPNSARWRYDQAPNNWDLGQLHYYTNLRKQNARVEEGRLLIEAWNEQLHGREYSSARLQSRQEWTYGRFEVLAKLPADGRGIVSAIWLLGNARTFGSWPASGEIDIMEHVGHQPDRIHATIHSEAYNHRIQTHKKATTMPPTARTDFNLYVLEWTPEAINVYVNDTHYFGFGNERLTNADSDYRQWPFDNRHHMILNISVGGNWVGNDRVDPGYFPQRKEIEFVRVYDCGEGRSFFVAGNW